MTRASSLAGRSPTRWIASAIVLALIVQVVGVTTWWSCWHWRAGHVVLTNDGPPLSVQVLDESDDRPIGEPQDLIRRRTLELPSGGYRLHVEGEARLSRTYRLAINRGESFTQPLTLDDNRLLGERPEPIRGMPGPRHDPIPFAEEVWALELTLGRSDLIEVSKTIRRRNGQTGEVVWDALAPPARGKPPRPGRPWIEWLVDGKAILGELVEPPLDLDGDGTRDLVWVYNASFVAVSGQDGSVLWNYDAELDGPGASHPNPPSGFGEPRPGARLANLIGEPATADLDRDGVPDIIATLLFYGLPSDNPSPSQCPIVGPSWPSRAAPGASSGATASNRPSSQPAASTKVPPAGGGRRPPHDDGSPSPTRPDGLASNRSKASHAPGRSTWASSPIRPLQYADLDGDGEPEILAVERRGRTGHPVGLFDRDRAATLGRLARRALPDPRLRHARGPPGRGF